MCNSFALCDLAGLELLLRELSSCAEAHVPAGVPGGGVVFPGGFAPVFMSADGEIADAAGRLPLEVRQLSFGWPVEWKRETAFNARIESLLEGKGFWGDALVARRCALPCATFFETHRSEKTISPRTGRPVRRRYRFDASDGGPLLLAAVYRDESFSVVTTAPNPDVAAVHDRMPLVLTVEEARIWLDRATPLERIARLADRSAIRLHGTGEGTKLSMIDQPELPF